MRKPLIFLFLILQMRHIRHKQGASEMDAGHMKDLIMPGGDKIA